MMEAEKMGWVLLSPQAIGKRPGRPACQSAHIEIARGVARLRPRLHISPALCAAWARPGAQASVRVSEDGRELLIQVDPAGAFLIAKGTAKDYGSLYLPAWSGLPSTEMARSPCEIVSVDGTALHLRMPVGDGWKPRQPPIPRAKRPKGEPPATPPAAARASAPPPAKAPIADFEFVNVTDYLKYHGHACRKLAGDRWSLNGDTALAKVVLVLVNKCRAGEGLDPVTLGQLA